MYKKSIKRPTRILLAIFISLVFLLGYFLIHNYHQTIRLSKQGVLSRLKAICATGVLTIDGELHEEISKKFMKRDDINNNKQDSSYHHLHLVLFNIQKQNLLDSDVYTIVYNHVSNTFEFIGTSASQPYYRHSYKNYPSALLENFETGGTIDAYEDENGMWLSAFAPIKNAKGKTVALFEVDERFETFIRKARNELYQNILISFIIIIPFAILLLWYISTSLKKQVETQQALEEQNEEIKSQNEEIKSQSELLEQSNHVLEQRVKERTIELTKSNQQLSSFIYHSSHDIQAPIATIKGILTLASLDLNDDKANRYFKLLETTTIQLDKMVKTLQTVHEIKSRELLHEKLSITHLIEEVCMEFEKDSVFYLKRDELINEIIHTDKSLLKLILYEIIKNATQYGLKESDSKIEIEVSSANHTIEIVINDNGDGIAPEKQTSLFTLFNRSHENSRGMGLGLFIAQTCANRLSGNITLLKKKTKGARFLVRLPIDYENNY